ncbi:uncharacterized protein LOC117642915 [Thrips palmi]|uniref:Uncharacterized protein LOC117642915 n=1 Tax=Thrips palmi TaxID=161013 RepID=A0A6P8YCP1_THRPL|nr:uncharacterized protein LOC117642915 [Thrips palmi]
MFSYGKGATRPTRRQGLRLVLRDICEFSSIHGLRYTLTGAVTPRVIWSLAVMSSATAMAIFSGFLWPQFTEGKTEVRLVSTRVLLDQRPFPAVAICPEAPVRKDVVRDALVR